MKHLLSHMALPYRLVKYITRVITESRRASNPSENSEIFRPVYQHLMALSNSNENSSIKDYLANQFTINRPQVTDGWKFDEGSGEFRLAFAGSIFAPSQIRLFLPEKCRRVVVFCPGTLTGADVVMEDCNNLFSLRKHCESRGLGLAAWDWPLQGSRLNQAIYYDLGAYTLAEREYSRILPFLGTALFNEYLEELRFCLMQLRSKLGEGVEMDVVGWSQGACFSYFSPLLGVRIRKVVAGGSCALFSDLLKQGKTFVHGYFYYPFNAAGLIELDSVIVESIRTGTSVSIVFGDKDKGCMQSSLQSIKDKVERMGVGKNFSSFLVNGEGHKFEGNIRRELMRLLES